MASTKLGSIKGGKTGKSFDIYWDQSDRSVYVDCYGKTYIGTAYSASEAMTKAEAWLYAK
jgi:hypothetical protein